MANGQSEELIAYGKKWNFPAIRHRLYAICRQLIRLAIRHQPFAI